MFSTFYSFFCVFFLEYKHSIWSVVFFGKFAQSYIHQLILILKSKYIYLNGIRYKVRK